MTKKESYIKEYSKVENKIFTVELKNKTTVTFRVVGYVYKNPKILIVILDNQLGVKGFEMLNKCDNITVKTDKINNQYMYIDINNVIDIQYISKVKRKKSKKEELEINLLRLESIINNNFDIE